MRLISAVSGVRVPASPPLIIVKKLTTEKHGISHNRSQVYPPIFGGAVGDQGSGFNVQG